MSKGFLKFCKLISNLILGQIIVSNLAKVHKLRSTSWNQKKRTPNTIITQAYQSRCSSWKPSSKARIAWDFSTLLRIKQGEVSKLIFENDALPNWISDDFDKWRISQPKT